MIVKDYQSRRHETIGLRTWLNDHKKFVAILVAIGCLVFLGLLIGVYRSPIGRELSRSYWPKPALEEKQILALLPYMGKALHHGLIALFTIPDIPTVYVDIKFKHLRRIREWRQTALNRGLILPTERRYVPATIRINGKIVRTKVRLKGDFTDHLKGKRWSLRFATKSDSSFLGLRHFSLQRAEIRGWAAEPVFMEHVRAYDILTPRYFYVNTVVNGDLWGVMTVEERASKELLESQGRRESAIFRFDDKPRMASQEAVRPELATSIYDEYYNARLTAYGVTKIRKDPVLHSRYKRGLALFEGWREGRFKASEIFDVPRWAKFLALSELWHSRHQLKVLNLRLYYNPLIDKFEPIAYDRERQFYNDPRAASSLLVIRDVPFVRSLLKDPILRTAYEAALNEILNDLRSKAIGERLSRVAKSSIDTMRQDRFYLMDFPLDNLHLRADKLLARKNWVQKSIFKVSKEPRLQAYYASLAYGSFYDDGRDLFLQLSNMINRPIRLCGLHLEDPTNGIDTELNLVGRQGDTRIGATKAFQPNITKVVLRLTAAEVNVKKLSSRAIIKACLRAEGAQTANTEVFGWGMPPLQRLVLRPPVFEDLSEFANKYSFLKLVSSNELALRPGSWHVSETIVIPKQARLSSSGGVTLNFAAGTSLVSYGGLAFKGEVEDPIILRAAGREPSATWGGVVVIGSGSTPSSWHNVIVRNTTFPKLDGWTTTGAVTFFASVVDLNGVSFRGSVAEDALNIVSSKFKLVDGQFSGVRSDAFDCDFCTGEIEDARFERIGGDGLDISGSTISISDSQFVDIGDKAISVGEASSLNARKLSITNAAIGVASKDGSSILVDGITLGGIRNVGLAAFMKKSEYGHPGTIEASNIVRHGQFRLAQVEHGGRITLDGTEIEAETMDLKGIYPGVTARK
jgi:hypothetical protein